MSARHVAAIVTVALIGWSAAMTPAGAAARRSVSLAEFEGSTIDLTEGWGEATACASDGATTHCFRTEAEMDEWLAAEFRDAGSTTSLSSCGSSLRLYSDGGFGGSVLYLSDQGYWIDLPGYGFNDVTSSFKIGACDSYFAEDTGGGGSWYPGSTTAWTETSVMASGWNDRVSSVYIT